MSELAYNINGEGFEVPDTATGWRVRRMKARGAPEVVYGRDGVPLVIPIESDLEELRRSVDAAGKFRLDAVDDRGRNIEGVQPSYVVVAHSVHQPATPVIEAAPMPPVISGADGVVAEAMRLNTELAKSVIERFPEMMHAAAVLLRAADGAGLPARPGRAVDDDDNDDEEGDEAPAPSTGFDLLNTFVAQLMPAVVMGFTSGKMKLPKLGALLDWRKAVPANTEATEVAETLPTPTSAAPVELPPIAPAQLAHFIAIQSALDPDEAALAREIAKQFTPAEIRAWFDDLSKMAVADAVKTIRGLLKGGAS